MTKTIHDLPPELILYIISKLDGRSLARASCVCKRWQNVVFNLGRGRGFNIWYRHCLKELGLDLIIAQTGHIALATENGRTREQFLSERWEFWKDLYAANQRCKCVGSRGWKEEILTVKQDGKGMKDMSVMAATVHPCARLRGGGRMYVGFREGFVCYINLDEAIERTGSSDHLRSSRSERSPCPIRVRSSTKPVNSISIVSVDELPGYSPGNFEDDIIITQDGEHSQVMCGTSTLKNNSHSATCCGQINWMRVACMSSLGSYIVVGDDHGLQRGILVYRVFKLKGEPRFHLVLRLRGQRHSKTSAVALAHNQVVTSDWTGNLYSWCFSPLSRFDSFRNLVRHPNCHHDHDDQEIETICEPTHHIKLPYGVAQIIIHHHQLFVLTNPGDASIHVINTEDWSKMWFISGVMLRELDVGCCSEVQLLAACGPLLAVGYRTGEVMVFNVSSQDWMKNLSASIVSLIRFPIQSLVALNFVHEPEGPALIASGDYTYLCRWRKCQEEINNGSAEGVESLQKMKTDTLEIAVPLHI